MGTILTFDRAAQPEVIAPDFCWRLSDACQATLSLATNGAGAGAAESWPGLGAQPSTLGFAIGLEADP